MSDQAQPRWQFSKLPRELKVISVILLVLGVGGIVLGFQSFAANIRAPFELQLAEGAKEGPYLTPDQQAAQEEEALKQKDSDGDGLSDYDELRVFQTSPYLADTDSDGFDDRTEVFSDNDPNCPVGEDCGQLTQTAEDVGDVSYTTDDLQPITGRDSGFTGLFSEQIDGLAGTSTDDLGLGDAEGGALEDAGLGALSNLEIESEADLLTFFEGLSSEQIRAAMIQAGVEEEQVSEMSDEEVKRLFDQAIRSAQETGQFEQFVDQIANQDPQE